VSFACNIDRKGRVVRLVGGLLLSATGCLGGLTWALPTRQTSAIAACVACVAVGGFMIFEARASWCVVRALGFKTPV
jgi:hypothetical protein